MDMMIDPSTLLTITPRATPAVDRRVRVPGDPGKASASGHAGPKPGDEDEEEEEEADTEDTPPGEHKREPIKDPDPADTKLRARPASGA